MFERLFFLVFFMLLGEAVFAVQPDEILKDPAIEMRAREISSKLRCLVCQNESIDDSSAPFARDLRLLVRERLVAGDSNQKVINFITDRYGNYVLLKPPFTGSGIILWSLPFIALILAIGIILVFGLRGTKQQKLEPLDEQEQKALKRVLDGFSQKSDHE